MKGFFLIAVLIGVTSGMTFKNQLLETLDLNKQRLIAKMDYCMSHSQYYIRSVYKQMLNFTHQMRTTIQAFEPQVQQNWQIEKEINLYVSLNRYIADRFLDASPEETSKTSAIYLAAMKEVTHVHEYYMPEDHLKAVQRIIDIETDLATKPTILPNRKPTQQEWLQMILRNGIDSEYRQLRDTYQTWWVPSFEDHYELANRTRDAIVIYKQHGKIQEAARIENILREFDHLTILLAREWPISAKQKMDSYYNTSQEHYKLYLELQHLEPYQYPIREILIEDLNTQEILVNQTIRTLKEGQYWYYIKVLEVTYGQIRKLTDKVLALPVDAKPEQAAQITAEVAAQQKATESRVQDPAPGEPLKAKALYLSVTMKAENQTGSAQVIYDQVKKIADKQLALTTPEMPLEEKLQKYAGSAELQKYLEELRGMVSGHVVWGQEQDSELIRVAYRKSSELEKKDQMAASYRIEEAIRRLSELRQRMIRGMPIMNFDAKPPYSGFYQNCQEHYELVQKLKALISK